MEHARRSVRETLTAALSLLCLLGACEDSHAELSVEAAAQGVPELSPCHDDRADASTGTEDAGIADAASLPEPDAQVVAPDAGGESEPKASIISIATAGLGCPKGTAQPRVLQGDDALEVAFPDFTVASSADRDRGSSDCTVDVRFDVPAGKKVALERLTLSGDATLPADATVRASAFTNWVGSGGMSAERRTTVAGPLDGGFEADAVFGDALDFSKCGNTTHALNINLDLSYRTAEAGVSVRAAIDKLSKVRFVTRDCD